LSFTTEESPSIFDELYNVRLISSNTPIILPHIGITKEVWSILGRLRMKVVKNMEDHIDILKQISTCLITYHKYIIEDYKNTKRAEETIRENIKLYLHNHYMFGEECRLTIIQRKFKLKQISTPLDYTLGIRFLTDANRHNLLPNITFIIANILLPLLF